MIENIRAYWEKVNDDDLTAGQAAYPAYLAMMRMISDYYSTGLVPTTEAFVALSPNNDYYGNLRSLISLIEGYRNNSPYTISTYKACGERAMSYLNGSVSFLDTVKGKKITAFRHNILYQKDSRAFVLDGHMIAIALGRPMTMSQANAELRTHKYEYIEHKYQTFARKLKMPVHEMQATLWHCRKRTEGIKFSTQRDFYRDDNHLYYTIDEIPPYPLKDDKNDQQHGRKRRPEVIGGLFD